MKNETIKILILILIVLATFAVVLKNACNRPQPQKNKVAILCKACNSRQIAWVKVGDNGPFYCVKCNKTAAYRALECIDCGAVFRFRTGNREKRLDSQFHQCPKCGSSNTRPLQLLAR
jgi:hypothetical protein